LIAARPRSSRFSFSRHPVYDRRMTRAPQKKSPLTHITPAGRPAMVDVGAKAITRRTATAEAILTLPPEVDRLFVNGDLQSPKGPVFHTAIIAGTQAVKDTSRLIPFCHPLPIERCTFDLARQPGRITIRCTVAVTAKTGVEMEALTGATVAALTIYDMTKAASHAMEIHSVRLLAKAGGRRTITNGKAAP
jgi:cyclic pyranopterin phosphate synthase